MSNADPLPKSPAVALPPILRAESQSERPCQRGWLRTIAMAFAGFFTAFPTLDRLGVGLVMALTGEAAAPPPLGWSLAGVLLAVLACHALLYYPLALWGQRSGRGLGLTSASAMGTMGAEWLAGVLVALGAIVAYSIALHMALRLVFLGLFSCGLLDRSSLQPWSLGPIELESPVFLVTAAFWIFITGMTAVLRIPSVIFALMQVYTPAVLLLLAATAVLAGSGLPSYVQQSGSSAVSARTAAPGFQLIFGAFALPCLLAVEWGRTVLRPRDLRLGGWIGILAAGSISVTLAILTVAGAIGAEEYGRIELFPDVDVLTSLFSLHWAVLHGIGGTTAGTLLILFGLASLAPACYAAWVFSRRLEDHWPGVGRAGWIWLGSLPAFVLVASSLAGRLETLFGVLGAVFAPVAGVIAADALRHRFGWQGVREGWYAPGVAGWGCGVVAGLALRDRCEPASLLAYLVAAAVYLALGSVVPARPLVALPANGGDPRPLPGGSAEP